VLAVASLLAELTTFRGPGFYFSLIKFAITIGVYLSWVGTADWVNRDAPESRMPNETWNPVLLACGLVGLLFLWVIPMFLVGLLVCAMCIAGGGLTYVVLRNKRVPKDKRVLTPVHLREMARNSFRFGRGKKVKKEETLVATDGKKPVSIRFFSRGAEGGVDRDDENAIARVQESKGYKAAMEMVVEALERRATDIHLEPTRDEMSVRFRIDGILQAAAPFSRAMGDAIVNIFKVLSKMDITEKRKPQDGSFSAEVDDRQVDFRVATAGSVSGEKMVMRILDKSAQIISLKQLGMRDKLKDAVRSVARLPHGMMIVCGPTGAGKSTTLYACLNELDRYQQNIITIENPVEYQLVHVTQIEVNIKAGKTFASELRSILRQDPDVIMVGEIRDKETAEIACQAAQTGHMVFTTLHANDTVTSIGRLIDLGVQPFMLGSALTSVLGQRLVRVLCPKCKVRYKPNTDLMQRLNLPVDKIKYFYRPPGSNDGEAEEGQAQCDYCGGTGYHGRTGIFEFLVVNDAIRALIRDNPNLNAIKQEAIKSGMRYLYEDGLQQVIEGRTSIQELLRVSK
jgi:type II secretory ATPase GspE/PulE/Tfp pilus assembly ATPase PilB-like protein